MYELWDLGWWIVKFLIIGISAVLYRIGGWKNKIFRRLVMPLFYIGACNGIAAIKGDWSYLLLIPLPFLIGALSLGYGSENLWEKIKKRAIAGLAVAVSFLPYAFYSSSWNLYILHCILCVAVSILSGVWNNYSDNASAEEATIAVAYCLMPIMMI